MKYSIVITLVLLSLVVSVSAQSITNQTVQERIRAAGAGKNIELTFDAVGRTTKIMAVSENFSKNEASRSGILAMNFAVGLFYPGDDFVKAPESFLLTFWVMSKKPRFGSSHSMTVALPDEMLVIGSARYVAKPAQQMEYLNFEVSRESLAKIATNSEVRFQLGDEEFTFTSSQMKLMADLLTVTEVKN